MSELTNMQLNSLADKILDADDLIQAVIKKVPKERKRELLAIINGFILGANSEKPIEKTS